MLVAMMGNEHKAYWDCKTDPSLPLSLTYLPSLPPLLTYLLTYSLSLSCSSSLPLRLLSKPLPLPASPPQLQKSPGNPRSTAEHETPEALPNMKPPKLQKHCRTRNLERSLLESPDSAVFPEHNGTLNPCP